MRYTIGLARYLVSHEVSVEFLSTGSAHRDGSLVSTPLSEYPQGEIRFMRLLSAYVRRRKFPSDTVVVANTEWYSWAFYRARRRIPVVLVAHGPSLPTLRARKPIAASLFSALIEPRGVQTARSIIAIDKESQEYFSTKYPGTELHRIPLGVDINHFKLGSRVHARARWDIKGRPALLFVGRLEPEKRPQLAASVFRAVQLARPEASLIVAGTGSASKSFDDALAKLGHERVRLLGFVSWDDLPSLYCAVDALLVTSEIEQFPTVILESLACGTQVFSTSVGDAATILENPVLGVICPDSVAGFAQAILNRIPENEAHAARNEEIRRTAAERYSWDRVGPEVLAILEAARTGVTCDC